MNAMAHGTCDETQGQGDFILVQSQVVMVCGLHGDLSMDCWLSPGGRPCPPYIGQRTRSVDRSPNRLQRGNLSLVDYNFCHISSIFFGRNPRGLVPRAES
jgi:hypothetical protein